MVILIVIMIILIVILSLLLTKVIIMSDTLNTLNVLCNYYQQDTVLRVKECSEREKICPSPKYLSAWQPQGQGNPA